MKPCMLTQHPACRRYLKRKQCLKNLLSNEHNSTQKRQPLLASKPSVVTSMEVMHFRLWQLQGAGEKLSNWILFTSTPGYLQVRFLFTNLYTASRVLKILCHATSLAKKQVLVECCNGGLNCNLYTIKLKMFLTPELSQFALQSVFLALSDVCLLTFYLKHFSTQCWC